MCQLKRVGHAEKKCLIHDRADELQTNGQALGRSTARDGNSTKPTEIRRAVVAEQESPRCVMGTAREAVTVAREAGCLFTDERCRNGRRGQGQGIQSAIGHHGKQAAKEAKQPADVLKAAKTAMEAEVDLVKADLAHRLAYVKLMALIGKP